MDNLEIVPSPYLTEATRRSENALAQLMHRLEQLPPANERAIGALLVKYVSLLADRERELVRCHVTQAFDLVMGALATAGLELAVQMTNCDACEATGKVLESNYFAEDGLAKYESDCEKCGGTGKIEPKPIPPEVTGCLILTLNEDGKITEIQLRPIVVHAKPALHVVGEEDCGPQE